MNIKLLHILDEEKSIFRDFNTYEKISNKYYAFICPDSNQIPHWNMVYPSTVNDDYSRKDIECFLRFYKQHGLKGHVLLTDDKWEKLSVETSEYFYLNDQLHLGDSSKNHNGFNVSSQNNIVSFCQILKEAFELDDKTVEYFTEKMKLFSKRRGSKFWTVSYKGQDCGCASIFKTEEEADFMFNVAILPKYQGMNLGSKMIKYIAQIGTLPMYVYSDNMIMRNKILPEAGFKSTGVTYVVEIYDCLYKCLK